MKSENSVVARISAGYGVSPPTALLNLAELAHAFANRDGVFRETDYLCYAEPIFDFEGIMSRPVREDVVRFAYPSTPPELFVFGSPGVDGIHYGFVVHAPELPLFDYPLAVFNPMDAPAGVRQLGKDANEGLARLIANRRATLAVHKRTSPRLDEIAFALGLHVPVDGEDCVFDPNWPRIRPPDVPEYKFQPSEDGVGVWAPESSFAADADVPASDAKLSELDEAAKRAMMRGYPATTLLIARELRARRYDPASQQTAFRWMVQAYRMLDRPLLANITSDFADRFAPHWRRSR